MKLNIWIQDFGMLNIGKKKYSFLDIFINYCLEINPKEFLFVCIILNI